MQNPDYGRFMIETVIILGLALLIGLVAIMSFPNVFAYTLTLVLLASVGYLMGIVNTKFPYRS
jgi:hypothetical protein